MYAIRSYYEQALLAGELENLLDVFHFKLDFPESFPANLRYPFIRNFWAESHVPMSFGNTHIGFCDYEEKDCPFPGYCSTCKEIEAEMKFDEETGSPAEDWDFDVVITSYSIHYTKLYEQAEGKESGSAARVKGLRKLLKGKLESAEKEAKEKGDKTFNPNLRNNFV